MQRKWKYSKGAGKSRIEEGQEQRERKSLVYNIAGLSAPSHPPPHPQSRPAQGSGLLPGPHPSHSPQACPGLPLAPNLNFDYNMSKCLPTLNRYNMFTSNIHSMFSSFFSCLFYFSTDSFLSSKLNNFYHRHTFYNHKTQKYKHKTLFISSKLTQLTSSHFHRWKTT